MNHTTETIATLDTSLAERTRESYLWAVTCLASMDFFTVPTLTGRVLFVLVLLSHRRRRIVHVNVTDHPTASWSAQQVVEAFSDDTAPTWLHRDRAYQRLAGRLRGSTFIDGLSGENLYSDTFSFEFRLMRCFT